MGIFELIEAVERVVFPALKMAFDVDVGGVVAEQRGKFKAVGYLCEQMSELAYAAAEAVSVDGDSGGVVTADELELVAREAVDVDGAFDVVRGLMSGRSGADPV